MQAAVRFVIVFLCLVCQMPSDLGAEPVPPQEEYGLTNALPKPEVSSGHTTRPVIVLKDGERIDPWVVVPEGWIVSDDGSLLTDEGVIVKADGTVEYPFGALPEGYVRRPDGTVVTPEGYVLAKPEAGSVLPRGTQQAAVRPKKEAYPRGAVLLPDGSIVNAQGRVLKEAKPVEKEKPQVQVRPEIRTDGEVVVRERNQVREQAPQLWSMLPLSEVPGQKPKPAQAKPEKPKQEKSKPAAQSTGSQEKPKKEEQPKKEEKPAGEPKREKPAPRIGETLSIPPEALTSGKLDFLEGCWQGTRPEYYSKRTIQECFCFGKEGKNGKRRVIDPQFNRRCVGGSQARLDPGGVLHVASQGAVCSDGERWGQAEMTCRGKGKQTPCSWIFKDANGGRQAYEIPFVRVQSCGRRR